MLWTRGDTAPCFALTGDPPSAPVLCGTLDVATKTLAIGTIERIDPSTGNPLWTFDAGAMDAEHLGARAVRFDSTHFAFQLSTGDAGLDLAVGPTGAPASTDGWCLTDAKETAVEGKKTIGATSWSPCTLGVGANHTPPTSVPEFAGPTIDGFGAWVEDGEVRAAKVS
jgi:hypothetical protein